MALIIVAGDPAPSQLATPGSFATGTPASTSIPLTWNYTDDGQTGFEIRRSTDNSSWSTPYTPGSAARSQSATGLTPVELYYFQIRAVDSGNTSRNSPWSSSISETTDAASSYAPFYTWSAAGGTLGNTITGWSEVVGNRLTYSDAVSGPFGGNRVARQGLLTNSNFFGGRFVSNLTGLNIAEGSDLWIRIYHLFPADFCFSSGNVTETPWGATKWYRLQFGSEGSSNRLTVQLGDDNGTGFASGSTCRTSVPWGFITDEYGGGGTNKAVPTPQAASIVRGTWAALQSHIKLSSSSSTGYAEHWINDTYLGRSIDRNTSQNTYATRPSSGALWGLYFGDYWNGAPYYNTPFYIDEIICTIEQPSTTDSGGRPYISPSARVADF